MKAESGGMSEELEGWVDECGKENIDICKESVWTNMSAPVSGDGV